MTKVHFRAYTAKQIVLFPQRIDEDIAEGNPVRIIDAVMDRIDLSGIYKLYKPNGRCPFHSRMMLKAIVYGYMNNVYSCRKIESRLKRDIHFIWLAGYEKPDFITISRFRNCVKKEINEVFTQLVLILLEKGFVSLGVEYTDGTKIETKANKYTFVWRKTVEKNREKLLKQIGTILSQVDDAIAPDNSKSGERVEITPEELTEIANELKEALEKEPKPKDEAGKAATAKKRKMVKEIEKKRDKLQEYNEKMDTLDGRNSYSKTNPDATFMRMKEDAMNNGQTKPGYNLQIGTENQFVTDFSLFPNPTDTLTLIPLLNSFSDRYGRLPNIEVADSGYGSEENYRFMEENGVEAYVKYNWFHKEQRPRYTTDPFNSSSFYYNKEKDYYVCPIGQHMERVGTRHGKTAGGYTTEPALYQARCCEGCPLRCLCYKSKADRRTIEVNRRLDEYKRKARERLTSEEGRKY